MTKREVASLEIKNTGNFGRLYDKVSHMMVTLRVLLFLLVTALPCQTLSAADAPPNKNVTPAVEDAFDQGLYEDALPSAQGPKLKPGDWGVTITADITVDYTFNDNPSDKFKIGYHIQLSGVAPIFPNLIRGNATIKTNTSGYLAKWTTGQCLLQVDVAAVPYEINVAKDGEDKLKLALHFKQKILEDWQSLCTFIDAPDRRFYTRGEPEKWIAEALQKADPSLEKLIVPISPKNKTETKFKVSKYAVKDGNLGNADVEGAGTVVIQPPAQPPEEKK